MRDGDPVCARSAQDKATALGARLCAAIRLVRLQKYHVRCCPEDVAPVVGALMLEIAYAGTLPLLHANAKRALFLLGPKLSGAQQRHLLAMYRFAMYDANRECIELATDADWEAWIARL
jgi:hypothetical protein